jgi:hypothetical protein
MMTTRRTGGLAGLVLNRPAMQFDSALADRLQSRSARRTVGVLFILAMILAGAFPAWTVWTELARPGDGFYLGILPQRAGLVWAFCLFLWLVGWPVAQRLVFLSIRDALPLPGAPFDERQQLVALRAQAQARCVGVWAMVAAFLIGLAMIFVASSDRIGLHPNVTPLYVWVGATLMFWTMSAHNLILAWTLPEGAHAGEGEE